MVHTYAPNYEPLCPTISALAIITVATSSLLQPNCCCCCLIQPNFYWAIFVPVSPRHRYR